MKRDLYPQPLNLDSPRPLSEGDGPVAPAVADNMVRRASAAADGSDSLSTAVASLQHMTPIAELVRFQEYKLMGGTSGF